MSRNGSGVYSLPPGSIIANGETSDATDLNTPLQDIETDLNTARPISSGGTGATSASEARANLGITVYNVKNATDFDITGSGDETAKLVAALNSLEDGDVFDLDGLEINVFNSVSGAASGDAANLADVPRLFEKSDITIQNGTIQADSPGVAGSKLRYPTTLTFDGCTDMKLRNVILRSKGENYGDTDASVGESFENRRAFAAQNGGHAFLFVRSSGLTADNCRFELAGSVASCYSMSSDDAVFNNCFSSPMSLGYGAFTADSWAGNPVTDTAFAKHEMVLNNCSSNANGATYGSKGCVQGDGQTIIRVNGGVWQDAYANGGNNTLGYAFNASFNQVYVTGGHVINCACVGRTTQASDVRDSTLIVNGVVARGLRTSGHIQELKTFGTSRVSYEHCDFEIVGGSLWGSAELSIPTLVASLKRSSRFEIDFINCKSTGAHTLAAALRANYGGVRILGGEHTASDRIFDCAAWGGAQATEKRGYEIGGGARIYLTNSSPSTALSRATTAAIAVGNQDSASIETYYWMDLEDNVVIYGTGFLNLISRTIFDSGTLKLREILAQKNVNVYQNIESGVTELVAVELTVREALAGSNVRVEMIFENNKIPHTNRGVLLMDDAGDSRKFLTIDSGPDVTNDDLRYSVFFEGSAYEMTVGERYTIAFRS